MKFYSTPNKTVLLLTAILIFEANVLIAQTASEENLVQNANQILKKGV